MRRTTLFYKQLGSKLGPQCCLYTLGDLLWFVQFKRVKNFYGGVLFLVNLQASNVSYFENFGGLKGA